MISDIKLYEKRKSTFIILLSIAPILFIVLPSSSEAQTCQVNITWSSNSTYTMDQNNTYYCLNQSWYLEGVTAINATPDLQNSTLDCLGYNLNGNDTLGTSGVYLFGSGIKNITIKNCNITNFGDGIYLVDYPSNNNIINNVLTSNTRGIQLWLSSNNTLKDNVVNSNNIGILIYNAANFNTLINNTAKFSVMAGIKIISSNNNTLINNTLHENYVNIWVESSQNNTIEGGSIAFASNSDYYLKDAGLTNLFQATNFTNSRGIYFYDVTSWFNYRNDTSTTIWLNTNVSSTATITRKIISWTQNLLQWNDTNSSGSDITARYNITGLTPNSYYNIYNNSILTYTLQTDSFGTLPSFTIYLLGEQEIKVQQASFVSSTLELNATKVWWNDSVLARGYMTRNGQPANGTLNLLINNQAYCSDVQIINGNWNCTFYAPLEIKTYTVTINYTDDLGNPGSNSTTLTVSPFYGKAPTRGFISILEQYVMIQDLNGKIKRVKLSLAVWR